jgi:hypothetical protein
MGLTIVVEHVFVRIIGLMDEPTIKANIYFEALNHGMLTLSDGKFKGSQKKKRTPSGELMVPRSMRQCKHRRNRYDVEEAQSTWTVR